MNHSPYVSAALAESKELCHPLPLSPGLLGGLLDQAKTPSASDPLLKLKRVYWRWQALQRFLMDFRCHWLAPSYSQEGEDGILRRIFAGQQTGFFVDIGAHHPKRYSNTYYFYLYGWRGINVDAAPESIHLFRKMRPRDINVEAAVADGRRTLTYYEFDEPTLNGLSREISLVRHENGPYRIVQQREVETVGLLEIFQRHLPAGQRIDFLNIDVEGLDLEVLQSNDWTKYRPMIVLAEDLCLSDLRHLDKSPVASFMQRHGYELYAKAVNTLIFRKTGELLPYERRAKFE
ncbi:MAG TPA: FkbM family methyltransferase [Verrucomicrobiae bacterium]|nr:FkbM family methyltransferase [Verrucomicrobiae bacterium]